MSAMQRLLERLQTGWVLNRDEIDPAVRQVDLTRWVTLDGWHEGDLKNFIAGFDETGIIATGPVLHWGRNMEYALTIDGVYWLEAP
jgi:hypothetical protein